ncbi:MAG: DUF2306 domain-containing protein [Anaerolineae bacterium]|nr:DUF2306 domain-containing protein [Anaerolineae bacterium]
MMTIRLPIWLERTLWSIVIILAIIGVAAVVRRVLDLGHVIPPLVHPTFGAFDAAFRQHSLLTLAHIIPGCLFMVLGPLQFMPHIRARYLTIHRWSGRVFIVAGMVIGISALIMNAFGMAIGGLNEAAATTLFALVFLFALGKAFLHIRRHQIKQHREWMIRAFAIGLAVATIRPIIGLFFAVSTLSPHEFFGIAFWLGFTIHLIAAEVWINTTRQKLVTISE